jgi:hypothetical protein
MAKQTINVGTVVNDGTGDDIRSAFVKVNNNFTELYDLGAQNNSGANVGTGVGIYKDKTGDLLNFKSLTAGNGIYVTPGTNNIVIQNAWPSISSITADDNHHITSTGSQAIIIAGSGGVHTSISGNTLTISGGESFNTLTNPTLGGNLNLNGHNITGTGTVIANLQGNLTGTVYNLDVRALDNAVNGFDFGSINSNTISKSFMEWLKTQYSFDLGTFTAPAAVSIDLGTIV